MIAADAEDFDIEDPPPNTFDYMHNSSFGLRKEVDIIKVIRGGSAGNRTEWETAILCPNCIDSINNNPDDPREVFPSGTREDQ